MPKLKMKWSTFLSLFKAKEVLHTCGRRIGAVLKAKASCSNEVEREMSCVYFTHFFNKRTKVPIFSPSYYPMLPKFGNFYLHRI